MKGHDGIIIVLCMFICFSMPHMYKIQKGAAMSEQRIKINQYLDTAVESAVYGNFDVIDDNFVWNRNGVLEALETEIKHMLKLDIEHFPVLLIRQGEVAFFYSDEKWQEVELGKKPVEATEILKRKMEQLLGCSDIDSVLIPAGNENTFCNPIYDYSLFVIMRINQSNYVVSGSGVLETVI